jgi:hypothetical protein
MATLMDTKEVGQEASDQVPSGASSNDESLVSNDEYGYCTFAVTGPRPYFQAIYICHACCSDATTPAATAEAEDDDDGDDGGDDGDGFEQQQRQPQPQHLCICQACAQICHLHEESKDKDGGGDDDNAKNDDDDDDDAGNTAQDDEAPMMMVEYIGMGPSYCDCPFNKKHPCRIAHASKQEARRLQIQPSQLHRCRHSKNVARSDDDNSNKQGATTNEEEPEILEKQSDSCTHFVRDVFHIPTLHDNEDFVRLLRRQAETLVQHSKETFWIDYQQNQNQNDDHDHDALTGNSSPDNTMNGGDGGGRRCALESLAWAVARNHIQHYASSQAEPLVTYETLNGMEWWVQVNHVLGQQHDNDNSDDTSSSVQPVMLQQSCSAAPNCTDQQKELQQGIELHYDKDEAVAESFGLGVFPSLSTVTYLCEPTATTTMRAAAAQPRVPPTLIFSHCYDSTYNGSDNDNHDDDPETNMTNIPDMLVSHAAPGKHLAFDGRLLHGAPAHEALRPPLHMSMSNAHGDIVFVGAEDLKQENNAVSTATANNNNHTSFSSTTRITFLVNLWTHEYKPAGVQILPDHVRQSLLELEQEEGLGLQQHHSSLVWDKSNPWQCQEIASVELRNETIDLPLQLCGRIELPFVGSNTLDKPDQEEEEEEEERLVVVTFPPPPSVHSTLRVHFGPGLQAYLDNPSFSTNISSSGYQQQQDESTLQLPASLARFCEQQTLETTPTCASASETAFI